MFFDALEFGSAKFWQFTDHETSHPTEFLWRQVQNQAEIGVWSVDITVAPASKYVIHGSLHVFNRNVDTMNYCHKTNL